MKANMNCPIHKVGFEGKESTKVTSRGEGYFFFFQRKTWTSFID